MLSFTMPLWGFPCGSVVKSCPANAGEPGLIFGSERSTGEGNDKCTPISLPGTYHGQESLPIGSQRVGHNLVTEHACTQSLYSMLNEKQNVFFTYTLHIVIYTK